MSALYIRAVSTCTPSQRLFFPLKQLRRTSPLSNMRRKSHHRQQQYPTGLWHLLQCHRKISFQFQLKHHTGEHLMEQKRPKSHKFQSCLLLCMKDRVRMEHRQQESTRDKLRDLALKWFTETQAPLILHKGNFPAWFQGFISRKDAEDYLRDKELGCFLIRLSDKATGYILSYRGRDRCRHFVINQNKEGQFIVTGDVEMHDTLTSLIEHYKTKPIEPFGEYLTESCSESSTDDIYDAVHPMSSKKPMVNVEAVRKIWDQRAEQSTQVQRPPNMPPKKIRNTQAQAVPPVPQRGYPLKTSSLDETSVLYAQLEKVRPQDRIKSSPARSPQANQAGATSVSGPQKCSSKDEPAQDFGTVYTELNLSDCRSKSLSVLDDTMKEEHSFRHNTTSFFQFQLAQSLQRHIAKKHSSQVAQSHSNSLDKMYDNSIYQLAGQPANPRDMKQPLNIDALYAEVPCQPVPNCLLAENTYEQIPGLQPSANPMAHLEQGNTYEALENIKPRSSESGRGIKNDKWKRLLPDQWKK
ncbi:SH2 domain-containing protein 7 [Trichomycterus rosablanca]|uniref:SH2 domain-containing protein 7 n=1 Tax=Trichomycterus rosablanca TaxID=2290929 RepID=UPI002F34FE65